MAEQIAPLQNVTTGRLPNIGTPGAPTVDVITVQGAASGTPIPVTGTFSASGAVTTAAPTYLTGTTQALSLTTAGELRVNTGSAGGGLTDTQLRASAVPVSGSGNFAITAASLPLPTGAATDAVLTGGTVRSKLTDGTNNVGVTSGSVVASETTVDRLKVNASLRLLDTAQTAGSQLVAAKGDQTTGLWVNVKNASLAVTGTFWQTTQPISGTVTVGNASLAVTGTFWQTTQPVSGTVTANAGTGTFAISAASLPLPTGAATSGNQPSNAAAASTTSGQTGLMNLGAVTTAAPAYTTATSNFLSLTTTGLLRTDGSGVTQPVSFTQAALPANQSVNVAQINGIATLMGNGVTGTGSQRVTIASDNTAFSVNAVQSGTWNIGSITTLPALPANQSVNVAQMNGVAVTMGSGATGTGVQRVVLATDVALPTGANTIGAVTGSGNFAITAASLPLPTGAATSANQASASLIGATTSGQTGRLTMGAVTTAAPTYTTATTNPLSLTTTGLLRTDGSGVTQPVSFTQQALPANQSVNVAQINGVAPTMGTGVVGTGVQRMTLATDVALPTGANVIGGVTQSGTWTVQPGNTANTTPWLAKLHDGTTAFVVKAASTAAATADPAVVVSFAGANSATKIGDGTNNAKVVAASTAAAFTDAALTVDLRPGGAMLTASAALADAFANPTIGRQANLPSLYNGTTWDLQRGMGGNATTGDTGAKTATGNGATQTNVGNKGVQILLVLGTVSGTTPTLVMKVQGSVDGGTTWYDIPGATTASLTATGNFGILVYPGATVTAGTTTTGTTAQASSTIPRTWRVVWTIGGTIPSFTITNVQYNYLAN